MSSANCKVIFRGKIAPDHNEADVRAALGKRLRLAPERVEALFTGKPVVIKRDIDTATAEKIRCTFAEAGAICEISGPNASEPAATSSAPPSATESTATASGAAVSSPTRTGGKTQGPGDDPNQTIIDLPIPGDLGDLALAPAGNLVDTRDDTPAPDIDTSELAVVEDDGPLAPRDDTTAPPVIDTSDLELAPSADDRERQ